MLSPDFPCYFLPLDEDRARRRQGLDKFWTEDDPTHPRVSPLGICWIKPLSGSLNFFIERCAQVSPLCEVCFWVEVKCRASDVLLLLSAETGWSLVMMASR
jgi:hypothetical protein